MKLATPDKPMRLFICRTSQGRRRIYAFSAQEARRRVINHNLRVKWLRPATEQEKCVVPVDY